jgi:hypothetical protein
MAIAGLVLLHEPLATLYFHRFGVQLQKHMYPSPKKYTRSKWAVKNIVSKVKRVSGKMSCRRFILHR